MSPECVCDVDFSQRLEGPSWEYLLRLTLRQALRESWGFKRSVLVQGRN